MSTRSRIGVLHADGSATTIYCHSDGYFGFNGRMLHEHWNSAAKAASLLKHGDMSVLGNVIGKKHDFDWRMKLDYSAEFHNLSAEEKNKYLDKSGEPNRYVYEQAMFEKDPRSAYCRYYGRDRGEKDTPAIKSAVKDIAFEEYCYLWSETLSMWICACTHKEFGMFKWHALSAVMSAAQQLPESERYHFGLYSFEEAGILLPTINLPEPVLSAEDKARNDTLESIASF